MTTPPVTPSNKLLAHLGGRVPPAPEWFQKAIAQEPERSFVPVNGAQIEALTWGRRGAPGLLLLHGIGANADWWSFIAPFFADRYRVTALSWSGMGRSDWREMYDFQTHVDEMFAVGQACGQFDAAQKPIIIAHSYGGIPLMFAGKERGADIGGAVIIDCYFRPEDQPRPAHIRAPQMVRSTQPYATFDEALARFRLEPPQACENLFLADYIARHSLKQVEARGEHAVGWTWRTDPELRLKSRKVAIAPYLTGMTCPLVMMSGARSNLITPAVKDFMLDTAPPGTPWAFIPDADHHVMLDQPLALTTGLNALLAVWPGQNVRYA